MKRPLEDCEIRAATKEILTDIANGGDGDTRWAGKLCGAARFDPEAHGAWTAICAAAHFVEGMK